MAQNYLELLKPRDTSRMAGVPAEPLEIPAIALLAAEKSITGSRVGGWGDSRATLNFAAGHGIVAQAEVLPIGEINTAVSRLRNGNVQPRDGTGDDACWMNSVSRNDNRHRG